ncbi:unnamed protein product [Phytophthora fragariaefolia]|uniref:Unnamed protein product n=1 Tax=Phytophthora fragariaefolia TaxID=1490495 RepID=A0A9W6XU39_9STRA|nr:unnamed protein product [Phytophthora fragariaefolia]
MNAYMQRQRKHASFPFQVNPGDEDCALQSLLCVGSTPGTLESVMDVIGDPFEGDLSHASLLVEIIEPTSSDPFNSMTVKWMDLDLRFQSMGFVKNHDYVYVEATGVLDLPTGRVGYQLLHSVEISGAAELPGLVRGKLSICSFFRQQKEESVSVYALGMVDSMSDRARRAIVPRFIKMMLPASPCRGDTMRLSLASARNYTSMRLSSSSNVGDVCTICSKRVWRLEKLLNRYSECSVCAGRVCSSCKIEKSVQVVDNDHKVTRRKLVFCPPSPCIRNALARNDTELSIMDDSGGLTRLYSSDYHSVWQSRISAPGPGYH